MKTFARKICAGFLAAVLGLLPGLEARADVVLGAAKAQATAAASAAAVVPLGSGPQEISNLNLSSVGPSAANPVLPASLAQPRPTVVAPEPSIDFPIPSAPGTVGPRLDGSRGLGVESGAAYGPAAQEPEQGFPSAQHRLIAHLLDDSRSYAALKKRLKDINVSADEATSQEIARRVTRYLGPYMEARARKLGLSGAGDYSYWVLSTDEARPERSRILEQVKLLCGSYYETSSWFFRYSERWARPLEGYLKRLITERKGDTEPSIHIKSMTPRLKGDSRRRKGKILPFLVGMLILSVLGLIGLCVTHWPDRLSAPYLEPLPYIISREKTPLAGLSKQEQERIKQAQDRAAQYLLGAQRRNGSWGIGRNLDWQDNSHAHVPITVLGVWALETASPAGKDPAIDRAVKSVYDNLRSQAYVYNDLRIKEDKDKHFPNTNNFHPYAVAYGLSMLLKELSRQSGPERESYVRAIEKLLEIIPNSPMYYLPGVPPASFDTALLAEALLKAKEAGFKMPHSMRTNGDGEKAVASKDFLDQLLEDLETQRLPHGGFAYHAWNAGQSELSTMARDPLIELVLYKAGRSDVDALRDKVHVFVRHRQELEYILKTDTLTHDERRHDWAKYYYLFGMYWTTQALSELPDPDAPELARQLIDDLLRQQSPDGSWVDSPVYTGPSYGAASGILTLETLARVAARAPAH